MSPVAGPPGCFGDVGHCDVPGAADPFDLRPAHQLEPAVRILTVTEPLRAMLGHLRLASAFTPAERG